MNEKTKSRAAGFISRWFCLIMTVASFVIACFFNHGYWFFLPFLIPITVLLFKEDRKEVTFSQEEDEA